MHLPLRYDIMLKCWQQKPEDRPAFSNLVVQLGDFLESSVHQVSHLHDDDDDNESCDYDNSY